MKKKLMMILAVIVMVTMLIPGFLVSAETYYYWNGTGVSGYGNTMKFDMTQGYFAFCVDINTYIHENIKYITKALEDEFDVAKAGRIRAILNYSWDKTSKTEITAIQQHCGPLCMALLFRLLLAESTAPFITISKPSTIHFYCCPVFLHRTPALQTS